MPVSTKLKKIDYQSSFLKFRALRLLNQMFMKKVTTYFILFQEYLPAYRVESPGTSELMPFLFVSDLNTSFFSE